MPAVVDVVDASAAGPGIAAAMKVGGRLRVGWLGPRVGGRDRGRTKPVEHYCRLLRALTRRNPAVIIAEIGVPVARIFDVVGTKPSQNVADKLRVINSNAIAVLSVADRPFGNAYALAM